MPYRWTDKELLEHQELRKAVSRRLGCTDTCVSCNQRTLSPAGACLCWRMWVYAGKQAPTHPGLHVCTRARAPLTGIDSEGSSRPEKAS